MIITSYGLIVFQLVIWIGVASTKSRKSADERYGTDLLGFAYPAIPTRHEVPSVTLADVETRKSKMIQILYKIHKTFLNRCLGLNNIINNIKNSMPKWEPPLLGGSHISEHSSTDRALKAGCNYVQKMEVRVLLFRLSGVSSTVPF